MSGRIRLPVAALLALATAGPAPLAAVEIEDFGGRWVRVEQERDDALRNAEIERVTASMSFVYRGAARAIMRRAMRPAEHYLIARDGEHWSIRSDGGDEYVIDGEADVGGADEQVTSHFTGGEIRQSWRHGASSRGGTVWQLGEDGDQLRVSETVEDENLDGTMTYPTTYRRAGD